MNSKVDDSKPFRFTLPELAGAFGDLGTLLPLMVGLILVNGLNPTSVLAGVGLFYIVSGWYYRIPIPVQPLKAVAAIAISLRLSSSVIGAAGVLMGVFLLFLSLTNAIHTVVKLFPQAVVKGIQWSIGLILLRRGIELVFSREVFINSAPRFTGISQLHIGLFLAIATALVFILFKFVFFRQSQLIPPVLALFTFGLASGITFASITGPLKLSPTLPRLLLPSAGDFWLALTALVIPQLPLTLGNAVVATCDTARIYFNDQSQRVTPRALATSMGLANLAAGLMGAMPMCHGAGGLTAHYKSGARTGGATLMIGGLLLAFGVVFGSGALPFLSLIPLSVLGVLLAAVGIYHTLLVRDLRTRKELAVAGIVALITVIFDNLAYGFVAGTIMFHLIKLGKYQNAKPVAN